MGSAAAACGSKHAARQSQSEREARRVMNDSLGWMAGLCFQQRPHHPGSPGLVHQVVVIAPTCARALPGAHPPPLDHARTSYGVVVDGCSTGGGGTPSAPAPVGCDSCVVPSVSWALLHCTLSTQSPLA